MSSPSLFAHDLETGVHGRIIAVGHDSGDRTDRRVHHNLLAHLEPFDVGPHRLDDTGHVTARHVRKVRTREATGEPQVHVVEC